MSLSIVFCAKSAGTVLERLIIAQLTKTVVAFVVCRTVDCLVYKGPQLHLILNHFNQLFSLKPYSLFMYLILFCNLWLGVSNVLFQLGFPAEIVYAFLVSPVLRYMFCLSHSP
jgi:hypothetical protein